MKRRIAYCAALAGLLAISAPSQAQIFGPSDEEKAATKAHEDGQDAGIAQNAQGLRQAQDAQTQLQAQLRDLQDRVHSLTDSLARATGANEELSHQLSLLSEKIDQQQQDFDSRLCTLSAQQLGADAQSLNCAAAGAPRATRAPMPQSFTPGARLPALDDQSPASADPTPLRGRAPGVLGTLPASAPPARTASADTGSGDDNHQFDTAMNLLARAQYEEASGAFRSYADTHPDDGNLSPQALYWVAHLAAMQRDYDTAARTFAEQIKKYPKSSRSPDSMLEVGQVLIAQGHNSEGCTFLGGIKKQYPNASASTLAAATNARKVANCR
jgi:tol-pal system protein YbgF